MSEAYPEKIINAEAEAAATPEEVSSSLISSPHLIEEQVTAKYGEKDLAIDYFTSDGIKFMYDIFSFMESNLNVSASPEEYGAFLEFLSGRTESYHKLIRGMQVVEHSHTAGSWLMRYGLGIAQDMHRRKLLPEDAKTTLKQFEVRERASSASS